MYAGCFLCTRTLTVVSTGCTEQESNKMHHFLYHSSVALCDLLGDSTRSKRVLLFSMSLVTAQL